jgi:hypothetical protein
MKARTDLAGPVLKARAGEGAKGDTADKVDLMLAEVAEKPFTRDGWLFELKLTDTGSRRTAEGGRRGSLPAITTTHRHLSRDREVGSGDAVRFADL